MTKPDFHTSPETVPVSPERPLLIVDADEVLLRFAEGFERFLNTRALYLDLTSYRLHGNVRRAEDDTALIDIEVTALLDEFREELDSLEAVEHAREVLHELEPLLQVVCLSNVSAAQAPARLRNFAGLGFDFPLLVNSGPKGPAVRALARRGGRPCFFIDDIPHHLKSAAEHDPEVLRIHLIGDDRLRPLLPPAEHADLRAESWREAGEFIRAAIAEAR
jgi:FMN phosphatase YigB (HAD superfamily)